MTTQIRFTANKEMTEALKKLKTKLRFLSDAEIFKLAFSRLYAHEMNLVDEIGFTAEDRRELDEALADLEANRNIEGPFYSAEEFIKSMEDAA